MDERYRAFCSELRRKYPASPAPVLFGDGNPLAKVAIVGFKPELNSGERSVFTSEPTVIIRNMMEKLGVPAHLLWYTYIVKQEQKKDMLVWKDVEPWVTTLYSELEILQTRATILLGIESAWSVLGTDEPNVNSLRRKRFIHKRAPFTNFFVTYSPADVSRFGFDSEIGRSMAEDFEGVFGVKQELFKDIVHLK